jgi:hypothetical protein
MQTYFVETLAIMLAGKLLQNEDIKQYINYACCGALMVNKDIQAESIRQTEGIDDMLNKADAFRFGKLCAKVINRYMRDFDKQQVQCCEAAVANLFFGVNPDADEKIKESIIVLIRAFTRRAQIQTHTTKPGYEDIDKWLENFYRLQAEYDHFVEQFAQKIIDAGKDKKVKEFINKDDPIIVKRF